MTQASEGTRAATGGIHLTETSDSTLAELTTSLDHAGLIDHVDIDRQPDHLGARLRRPDALAWTPDHDTTGLAGLLGLDAQRPDDLQKEIWIALLASPVAFVFPNHHELLAAIRIRMHIVQAARRASLAFDTVNAERPQAYWTYGETTSFVVKPGRSLVTALEKATQPETGSSRYSFSCYRATEYITLLGLAKEIASSNPELAAQLQAQWEKRAIMSGEFHDVFLHEYGSMDAPLPPRFYVPGDRLWFRNPDESSANVEGFEGSWLFYLGGGLFNNFWDPTRPFDLRRKCVEIYHWRHGASQAPDGSWLMDESIVEDRVAASLADPQEVERILSRMMRLRDPRGVYAEGGCIDATRECLRLVLPGTTGIHLPGR